jgi:hypothetical protein
MNPSYHIPGFAKKALNINSIFSDYNYLFMLLQRVSGIATGNEDLNGYNYLANEELLQFKLFSFFP